MWFEGDGYINAIIGEGVASTLIDGIWMGNLFSLNINVPYFVSLTHDVLIDDFSRVHSLSHIPKLHHKSKKRPTEDINTN